MLIDSGIDCDLFLTLSDIYHWGDLEKPHESAEKSAFRIKFDIKKNMVVKKKCTAFD